MRMEIQSRPRWSIGCPPAEVVAPAAPLRRLRTLGPSLAVKTNGRRCYGSSARSWLSWPIKGVDLPIPPDGPTVRMVDQELVREEFYTHTPAVDGTPEQKRKARHMQFTRALAYAEGKQLIGVEEIDDVTYLRLTRPDFKGADEESFDPQGRPDADPQGLEGEPE